MSSDESESLLKDGLDKSNFRCLRHFFFFVRFFLLALESDDDDSDESDDGGSGSGFTFGTCFLLCIDLSTGQVIRFLSIRVLSC